MKGWLNRKTITSAADNSSANTGNDGEENVEESIEKPVEVNHYRKTYIATRNSFKELMQQNKKRQQII